MSSSAEDLPTAYGAVAIKDPTGLHARPAVKLTKLAKTFASGIEIRPRLGTALLVPGFQQPAMLALLALLLQLLGETSDAIAAALIECL